MLSANMIPLAHVPVKPKSTLSRVFVDLNKKRGDIMDTLYERLCFLCDKKGIKGGKMCVDLGLSKSVMTDLKSGRKKGFSAEIAQKIASYFGVSVGYLLGEENEETDIKKSPSEISEGEQKLLDLFRKVPESQRQMVLQMIEVALNTKM